MRSGFKKIPLQQGQRKRGWAGSLANRLWAWTTHSALWASVTRVGTIEASRLIWGLESRHSPEGVSAEQGKVLEHSPTNTPSTKSTSLPERVQEQGTTQHKDTQP